MINWKQIIFYKDELFFNGENTNISTIEKGKLLTIISRIDDLEKDIVYLDNFNGDLLLLNAFSYHIVVWNNHNNIELIMFHKIESDNLNWLYESVSLYLNDLQNIKNKIINFRYKYLKYSSLPYIPTTTPKIFSLIFDKTISPQFSELVETIYELYNKLTSNENIDNVSYVSNILSIIGQYKPSLNNKNEFQLLKTNLLYALTKKYVSTILYPKIIELGEEIINDSIDIPDLKWCVKLILYWYYDRKDLKIDIKKWDDISVPTRLLLLPHIINLNTNTLSKKELLDKYHELNITINEKQIFYDGIEYLQILIAEIYEKQYNYSNAITYYRYAWEIFNYFSDIYHANLTMIQIIKNEVLHMEELAIASNLFKNTNRINEAVSLAWSSLSLTLKIIKDWIKIPDKIDLDFKSILKYITLCKLVLLEQENEMSEIINLKLSELEQFINELSEVGIVQDTTLHIQMHEESIKFMIPQKVPLFLFITPDGRLIYSLEASINYNEVDVGSNYLVAGALTAIRTVFREATLSSGGVVKEIALSDSALLIEARPSIIITCAVTTITDEIRKFTTELANFLEANYNERLVNWYGDQNELSDITELITEQILEHFVYNE